MCVCVPRKLSNFSETVEVIIVKLGTVTASDMGMHLVWFILTLTFIQGHIGQNHENTKYLTISETFQAMSIKFAVKIVQLKVYMTIASPMTLTSFTIISVSQTWLLFNLQYLGQYVTNYIRTWHDGRLMDALYYHFDDLDLDARSQWVSEAKNQLCMLSRQLSKQ